MESTPTLYGTAFVVDGTWYVRHQGGQGVLLPLDSGDLAATLVSGQSYEFTGRAKLDHRGHAIGAHVTAAKPIGSAPESKA
jgi:hypothetical protein